MTAPPTLDRRAEVAAGPKRRRPAVTAAAARRRRRTGRLTLFTLLVLTSLLALLPFLAMVVLALTPQGERTIPDRLPTHLSLENFRLVLRDSNVLRWTLNSLIYAGVSSALVVLLAAMAGYGFAKKRFPGREVLFWSFLATLMVPFQATLIPYFVLVSRLHGIDTYWGMIVPTLANVQAVFLMRQFIRELPDELFQAARVDGASELMIFVRIVLPLTRPIMATLGVFVFLWHWNDFLWPLVVAQSDHLRTLTVGMATLQSENAPLGQTMAGAALTVVPSLLVFGLLQRYLVDSIAMTGLKD